MCGCEHHWNLNARCTCQCPSHQGVREEQQSTARREPDAETIRGLREEVEALRSTLADYFDFDVDSWDEGACPEPEDVWRLHRDLRAILARHERPEGEAVEVRALGTFLAGLVDGGVDELAAAILEAFTVTRKPEADR